MMRPSRRVLFFLAGMMIFGVFVSAAAAAEPAPPKKVATVEGITEYQLDNGLRLLLVPRRLAAEGHGRT